MSLIPNLVEGSILIAPILTIEYLHGYRKNTAKTFRKTDASAHSLKRLWDHTAPIEI